MPFRFRSPSAAGARRDSAPRVETLEGRRLLAAAAVGAAPPAPRAVFNDPVGGGAGPVRSLTVRNPGTASLAVTDVSVVGPDASMFRIVEEPPAGSTGGGGGTVRVDVAFAPPSGASLGVKTATLRVTTTSTSAPQLDVSLRALATAGETGANEPSLQRVLDLFELAIDAGDADPATSAMTLPLASPNDAVDLQTLVKAGDGPVTVEPLAVFASAGSPTIRFGHYDPAGGARSEVLSVAESQRVKPSVGGGTSFDPGAGPFGLYATAPAFGDRTAYTQDFRNTFEPVESARRKVLFYPLPGEADAFVVGFEEVANSFDFQDFVAIVRNVRAPGSTPPPPPVNPAKPELTVRQDGGAPLAVGSAVDFGSAEQGQAGPQRTFTLTNEGEADLAIGGVTVPAGYELVTAPPAAALAPGASAVVVVRAATVTAGTFQGQVVIASNDEDEAEFALNVAGTVVAPPVVAPPVVAPPVVAPLVLVDRASAALPPVLLAGKATRVPVTVTVRNASGGDFSGPLALTASLSDAAGSPTGATIGGMTRTVRLKAGAQKVLKLKAVVPQDVPVGDRSLTVSAAAAGRTHAAAGGAFRVEPAFVRLVVPHGTGEARALTFGKRARLAVPVQNLGNVPAARTPVTYDLVVSPTADGAAPVYQTTVAGRVSLKPGATRPQPLAVTFAPAAFAPGTYSLLVRLEGVTTPLLSFTIA